MVLNTDKKPCLVETAQGFSVSYNNKFLYSKYSPSKSIEGKIKSLTILPGTIFLCCSPVLEYGLKILQEMLPENCIILCAEIDPELKKFSIEYRKQNPDKYKDLHFIDLTNDEMYDLPIILNKNNYQFKDGNTLPSAGHFKRIVRLDMSAGVQNNPDFYDELAMACTNSLMTFWSNRITLTKFGRRYSKNFFTNLKVLPETTPIDSFLGAINKPIIVFGAGQSFSDGINFISKNRYNFFVVCVDTALNPLIHNNIIPDAVFIEEAQFIISKAFLGNTKYDFQIFAGLTSLPQINHIINPKRISYFTTLYTNSNFISNAQNENVLPVSNPPFGSVGLTAVYYSIKFRKTENLPIFICGLDFSYSPGYTHTKYALAHIQRLISSNRFNPVQNYNACFNNNSIKVTDKQNNVFFTNQVMINYSKMFNSYFYNTKNLYDIGKSGIPLSVNTNNNIIVISNSTKDEILIKNEFQTEIKQQIFDYLNNEISQLKKLKNILTGNASIPKENISIEIKKIAAEREYLYLHFPDGYSYSDNISFLKRIRTEIDYFLKALN